MSDRPIARFAFACAVALILIALASASASMIVCCLIASLAATRFSCSFASCSAITFSLTAVTNAGSKIASSMLTNSTMIPYTLSCAASSRWISSARGARLLAKSSARTRPIAVFVRWNSAG